MSTVIKMADAEKISNYQIRLDAMDKIYPNDTEKMLSEELQNDNGRKFTTFFKVSKYLCTQISTLRFLSRTFRTILKR